MKLQLTIFSVLVYTLILCGCNSLTEESASIESESSIEMSSNIESDTIETTFGQNWTDKLLIIRDEFEVLRASDEYINAGSDLDRATLFVELLQVLATEGTQDYPYPLLTYDSIEIEDYGNTVLVSFAIDDIYPCEFQISEYPNVPTL